MSAAVFLRPGKQLHVPESLIAFLFFAFGALAVFFDMASVPAFSSVRIVFGTALAALVLFSVSGLGWVLLPVGLFVFGIYAQQAVMGWYQSAASSPRPEWGTMAFPTLLVPSILLASSHSLCASSAFMVVFHRGSPTARTLFFREVKLTVFFVTIALLSVFLFY